MPDIQTVLHEAAPTPASVLDMAAVRARARRYSLRRRIIAALAGVGVAVGIGVPVGTGVLAPASQGERVGMTGRHTTEDSAPPTDDARPATNGAAAVKTSVVAALPGRSTTTTAKPQLGEPPVEYPSAASCTVDDQGLAAGAQRICRFTATRRGGASFDSDGPTAPAPGVSPAGEVKVTRNGQTSRHQVDKYRASTGDGAVFVGCEFF
ncbi:MAG: hypothetical protein QOI61_503, partial [Actinomycetota bacterium]